MTVIAIMLSPFCGPIINLSLFFLMDRYSENSLLKIKTQNGIKIIRPVYLVMMSILVLATNLAISKLLLSYQYQRPVPDGGHSGSGLIGFLVIVLLLITNLLTGIGIYYYNIKNR